MITSPRTLRLLLVDDSPEDRAEIRRLLLKGSDLRYVVGDADTGERALITLKEPGAPLPDAVLLDFNLPDMNAHEVLQALRDDDGETCVPVIVLTGSAGHEACAAILHSGAHDFIGKEWFTSASLTRALENTRARFLIQRELRETRRRLEESEALAREREVTALKQAAHEIQRREERLLLALEVARMSTWEWDIKADQIHLSSDVRARGGVEPALVQGTMAAFLATMHPDDRARIESALAATVERDAPYEVELRIVHSDGSVRWAAAKGKLQRDLGGKALALVGVNMDITTRKETEARREELLTAEQAARTEAERLGRMKDELLATLSHELRTPLNAILGWIGILRGKIDDEPTRRKALVVIDRNARLQAQLINDLLDMNRILSGKLHLTACPTSLASAAQAAIETVQPTADARGVALEIDLIPGSGSVYGDADRLQQIVWNILNNAIKFTGRGGTVHVALAREDESFALSVRDTGQGIAPEFLSHVFERFRQSDATAARRHGGLGLGLAIVRQIAELHGGTVRVASEGLGRGSTFTLVLPSLDDGARVNSALQQDDGRELRCSAPAIAEVTELGLNGIRVLLVDDQEDTREFVERILAERGARVTVAASAEEALARIEAAAPDVLVADIGMPDVDGYELIRRLRRRDAALGGAVPAVALTAFAREEDRVRAIAAGYDEHVPKPLEPALLFAAIALLAKPPSSARST